MRLVHLPCLVSLALAPAIARADDSVHDGLWRITSKVEMPGMPVQRPPMTHTQCLTRKDAVPQGPERHNCEVVDKKIDGGHVTWKMKCGGATRAEGSGDIRYRGNSFDGQMKMTMTDPRTSQPMQVIMTLSGERLGNCTK